MEGIKKGQWERSKWQEDEEGEREREKGRERCTHIVIRIQFWILQHFQEDIFWTQSNHHVT